MSVMRWSGLMAATMFGLSAAASEPMSAQSFTR